jgi:hypothetical protein
MATLQPDLFTQRNGVTLHDSSTAIMLTFHGPFTFTKGPRYLFNSGLLKKEGLYIWTIKDAIDGMNHVHYIGGTGYFARRQRQHLVQLTGLNYPILDATFAQQGIKKVIWNGMAHDKSRHAAADLLENYNEVSKKVTDYISLITIYFAPFTSGLRMRRHVQDSIIWNFRTNYPELKQFYSDDTHACVKPLRQGQKLILNLPEDIAGIDREQTI